MTAGLRPPELRVTAADAARIVAPYAWHQLREQLLTVVPVCAYLILVQLLVLRSGVESLVAVTSGIACVIAGLTFFMEGVKLGLIPMGDAIGDTLPVRASLISVLGFSFLLGNLAAFGEPVLGSLQIAGAAVDAAEAPLLHALLLGKPMFLALAISTGVGLAVVLGVIRFLRGWSLKPLVLVLVGLSMVLTFGALRDPQMTTALGLAWDCGAVIAGPVLVPLALGIGIGVCRAAGRSSTGMSGFGMVGLISLVPIVVVLLLILAGDSLGLSGPGEGAARHGPAETGGLAMAGFALASALRATVPVFAFLYLFLRFVLREKVAVPDAQILLAAAFAVAGLFLFNYGLAGGLGILGEQVGERLPLAFHPPGLSLFPPALGKLIVVLFGAVLGYGATLAEPAFNTMGRQVEEITQGAFKRWIFGQAVAIGVGIGAGVGVASLVYGIDLMYVLVPPYVLLFILTLVSDEKYVNIAWDGGAVTTGPVTVPLKIAIGIALSHATGFAEGFGILALASSYPVINILLLGLLVRRQERRAEVSR